MKTPIYLLLIICIFASCNTKQTQAEIDYTSYVNPFIGTDFTGNTYPGAIENSSAGAVIDMYDLLTRYDNYIVAETFLPVNHALLGVPGARLSDVKTVFSHPQALKQCSVFFK